MTNAVKKDPCPYYVFDWVMYGGPTLPPLEFFILCKDTCVCLWDI